MKSLYEITADAKQIMAMLEENEGELTPELEQALIINQGEVQIKSQNYALAIKIVENDINYIEEEIARLQALKKAKTNTVQRMRESVSNAMEMYGIDKIETPTLKMFFRKSESVTIINEDIIPDTFITVKTVRTPNKTKIKEAIKEGQSVYGAVLDVNYNLQIK